MSCTLSSKARRIGDREVHMRLLTPASQKSHTSFSLLQLDIFLTCSQLARLISLINYYTCSQPENALGRPSILMPLILSIWLNFTTWCGCVYTKKRNVWLGYDLSLPYENHSCKREGCMGHSCFSSVVFLVLRSSFLRSDFIMNLMRGE